MTRRRPVVFATAVESLQFGFWIVTYNCVRCKGQHHYNGGPLTGAPASGLRLTPCGNGYVDVHARPGRTP